MSAASKMADVIIVGGGPAGVAAALELRRKGLKDVVLLDREPSLGGATRHCSHSPFGMLEYGRVYFGSAYGRRLEADARTAGVDVRTGHSVVDLGQDGELTVTSSKGVETLFARRVLVASGTRESPRSARLLPGDRPIGILTTGALQAYIAFERLVPFRRPVIIGTELVSQSALMSCLGHGARPVAMIEQSPRPLARKPFSFFPRLVGVPLITNAEIVDIRGRHRVESITVRSPDGVRELDCDGILLSGHFTPEAALFQTGLMGIDTASKGPKVDQNGRCVDPAYFAAGNVLRPVETGGWSFREGRRIGGLIATDVDSPLPEADLVPVEAAGPIRLVVPQMLRRGITSNQPALPWFQLRMERAARGRLLLRLDNRTVWSKAGNWLPERRILVPIPEEATRAGLVQLSIEER